MSSKLTKQPSLNSISEERIKGGKATETDAEQTVRAARRTSLLAQSKASKLQRGFFTITHIDQPSVQRASNSVKFSHSLSPRESAVEAGSRRSSHHDQPHYVHHQPPKATFQLKPNNLFNTSKVRDIIKSVFESAVADNDVTLPNNVFCKDLAEAIKIRTRRLNYDRYRIISHVYLTSKEHLSLKVGSRCIWDDRLDNFADYKYEAKDCFIIGIVYGIYKE